MIGLKLKPSKVFVVKHLKWLLSLMTTLLQIYCWICQNVKIVKILIDLCPEPSGLFSEPPYMLTYVFSVQSRVIVRHCW